MLGAIPRAGIVSQYVISIRQGYRDLLPYSCRKIRLLLAGLDVVDGCFVLNIVLAKGMVG